MKINKRKSKISIYSTDYFFEWIYKKLKQGFDSSPHIKLTTIKILGLLGWFKDIS